MTLSRCIKPPSTSLAPLETRKRVCQESKGLNADFEEKREPVSDVDTVVVVKSLNALDTYQPIREADIGRPLLDHLWLEQVIADL